MTTTETEKDTKAEKTDTTQLFAEQSARTNDLLEQLIRERQPATAKQPEPEKPRIWTRQELQAAVDEGKITTGDMVEYLAEVKSAATVQRLRQEFKDELAMERKRGTVESKLTAYRASYPDLAKKGSELRKKVTDQFNELVEEGSDPNDLRTELMACRLALGEIDKPKAPAPRETTASRQRSVEAAGGRGDRSEKPAAGDSRLPSWMPDSHKSFYEREIAKGRYQGKKGEEELKRELEYLKKKVDAA